MKCGYNHCLYDGEVSKEEAVKHGSRYYHKKCLEQMQTKKEIRELYLEKVNPTEVVAMLNKVINTIIDVKKVDGNFLLYALKYAINSNFVFHSPAGLYYIINNYKIKEEFKKQIARLQTNEFKDNINNIKTESDIQFTYKVEQKSLMDKITQQ